MKTRLRRKILKAFKWACILYVISYAVLSLAGEYHEIEDIHGRRFAVWHPQLCRSEIKWRGKPGTVITWIGGFYLPLLVIDNKFIHPTKITYSVQGDGYDVRRISENGRRLLEY